MGRFLIYLWVSPATVLGLISVPFARFSGGNIQIVNGVIEVSGGLITRFLQSRVFVFGGVAAMTLGHVILGQDETCLVVNRRHEQVHVAQYERLGPLMIPLYLLSSGLAKLRGRHPYWDNHFEIHAFRDASLPIEMKG